MSDSSKNSFPILPLRDTTLFPENVLPLVVGRNKTVKMIKDAIVKPGDEGMIVLLSQKDKEVENPEINDIYKVGTLAKILKVIEVKEGTTFNVIVQGMKRVRLKQMTDVDPYFIGEFEDFEVESDDDVEEKALFQNLQKMALEIIEETPEAPKETPQLLDEINDADEFCDFIAANLEATTEERQKILEAQTLKGKMKLVLESLNKQVQIAKTADQIQENMMEETDKVQKEYYLRQQLKAIKRELGEGDDALDDLQYRLEQTEMPDEARDAAQKQLDRLRTMQSSSSEYSVTLNYVETLLDIPWEISSDDVLDLELAQSVLDDDHYGLEKVKDRIVEYLAVRTLKDDMRGPILCLSGPPGVGKSSLAKSIARSMGRKFVRIALGGVHDESEIRGHRRTYVGAMPGQLVKAMIKSGTNNPVILLDEIDKIGKDFKGDPQAAMLEVLDPEQNDTFADHFVEVPLDLSRALFIATANQLSGISAPLKDRMEIIEVPSYTSFEKKQIAKNHLVPKQIDSHGITHDHVSFDDEGIDYLIDRYTREAGVRSLERRIADVCRSVAVKVAMAKVKDEAKSDDISETIGEEEVTEALGPERFHSELAQRVSVPGVSTGLAWTQAGGDILFVEATKMKGDGKVKFTGQLGDVMKESVEAAISYLRSNAHQFGLPEDFMETIDVHVHFPAGAVPKDGPSAGITIFSAVLSILTGIKVKHDVAMTGEITLRGTVLPVGGIKEKVTAAHRAGIQTIIIPEKCRKDLVDVNDEIQKDIEFHFVKRVDEVPEIALTEPLPQVPVVSAEVSEETNGGSTDPDVVN